jgi:hypothetical protein
MPVGTEGEIAAAAAAIRDTGASGRHPRHLARDARTREKQAEAAGGLFPGPEASAILSVC